MGDEKEEQQKHRRTRHLFFVFWSVVGNHVERSVVALAAEGWEWSAFSRPSRVGSSQHWALSSVSGAVLFVQTDLIVLDSHECPRSEPPRMNPLEMNLCHMVATSRARGSQAVEEIQEPNLSKQSWASYERLFIWPRLNRPLVSMADDRRKGQSIGSGRLSRPHGMIYFSSALRDESKRCRFAGQTGG